MDYSNLKPVKPEPDVVEATDCRTHFDSRQTFIDKIILQNHMNLKKLLELEEQLYSTATSQSDYQQKVSAKMSTLDIAFQNLCVLDPLPAYLVINGQNPVLLASASRTESTGTSGWQEQVSQEVKAMKDMYLPDLTEMHQKVFLKLQQNETLSQDPKEQVERIRMMKGMLQQQQHQQQQ